MATKTRVRVTQEPNVVREVDDSEFLDLSRMGLIHSHNKGDGTSPNAWEPAERGEEIIDAPAPITDPAPADPAPAKKKKEA